MPRQKLDTSYDPIYESTFNRATTQIVTLTFRTEARASCHRRHFYNYRYALRDAGKDTQYKEYRGVQISLRGSTLIFQKKSNKQVQELKES